MSKNTNGNGKNAETPVNTWVSQELAEGVGFEPTLGLPLSLISSQVPSTTQPPFHSVYGPFISHGSAPGAS